MTEPKPLLPRMAAIELPAARSLETEIRRLCDIHGKDAVRDTAARLTKERKRDRLLTADFSQLRPFIENEARLFLEHKKRTSHPKIVDAVIAGYRVHSEGADRRRIMKRLASQEWKLRVLLLAYDIGKTEYPVVSFVKVCRAGLAVPEMRELAKLQLESMRADAARLSHRIGEVPLTMTRKQLADEAKVATLGIMGTIASGLLPQPAPSVTNAAFRDMSPTVENKSQDRQPNLR